MTQRRSTGQIQYGRSRSSWIAMPRGYIDGLTMTIENSQDINIATGVCRDSTNMVNMVITDLTKKIDATWAAGDDAGGLCDTDYASGTSGTESDTWYHFFIIAHTDGTVDAGFDKDPDAVELLDDSGYTHYRRIGSVLTDSGGPPEAITPFRQRGDEFLWQVPTTDWDSEGNLDTAEASPTVKTPPDIITEAILNVCSEGIASASWILIYSDYMTTVAPSFATNALSNIGGITNADRAGQMHIGTDTSSTVRARASVNNSDVRIATMGWIDPRGRNA